MAIQEFTVLYTHQKTKKSKVWQDGVLRISSGGNQASLYNDKGQRLDNVFIRTGKVNIGDDLESDRFLITVEAEGASSNTSENNTESKDVPLFKRYGLKSAGLRPPVGLKRKFTGFQCPREITKKPCPEVEESGKISSQQEQGCPSLSSPLFTTSPLFASTFSKKANTARAAQCQSSIQPDDYSYMCENQHSATSRITPVNDNTFSTNFSSNRNQAKSENFTGINVLEDGNRTKPSLRSTAQILALLKSQPSKEGTLTNLAGQHIDQAPAKSDSDLLGSTFAGGASSLKCENISLDPSTVKPHCVKSRWDVYLDPPSAPSTVYGDDNDSFVLSQSPDDRFKNNNKYCILSHGLEQEKMKGGSTWTMDKYMEGENTPMTEHKLNELEHVGNPSQKRLSNAEENCEHNLCGSGLGLTEPPTPMLCSSFHNPTKLELDDVESENENVTSFAEVSFNLMDSFDFNELDDGGSNGTPPLPQNRIVSAKEDMDKNQEYTIEEEKGGQKYSKNKLLFKSDAVKSLLPIDVSSKIVESNPDRLSVLNKLPESKVCDQYKEGITNRGEKLLILGESTNLSFSFSDKEEDIPSGQFALKSTDASHQEGLLNDDDSSFKGISGNSLTQNSLEGILCNEEDSPGYPHSESTISVLRALTKPCSALESLNDLKLKSSLTHRKRDTESEPCFPSGAQEALCRTCPLAIQLSVCEDVTTVPSSTEPMLSTFSPVHEDDDPQTLFVAQSNSPPMIPPACQEEQTVLTPAMIYYPVEFEGHRVKGAASSAVIIRPETPVLDWSCSPEKSPCGSLAFDTSNHFLSPSAHVVSPLLQNSAIFALDETFSDYSGSSQPAFVHTVTSHESNSFSPAQHPLPRWTMGSQGSECDWEFSQWTKSKVETPTQEKSDDLKRPFFLRPRQSFSVDSPGTQLKNGTSVLKQHNFLNTTRVSKVQTRIHKQLPMITQPEFVTSSLNPLEDEYDVLEIQKENSLLLKTHSYRSNETHSTIVADKNEGGDDYFKWLDTGPTSMGPPKNVPVSSSKQPSKWLKYQHVSSESSENIIDEENTEFCAQSVFRHPERIEEIQIDDTAPKPQVGALKQRPCQQSDVVSKVELITKVLTPANGSLPRMARRNLYSRDTEDKQIPLSCDLTFPPEHIVLSASIPKRKVNIPAVFQSSAHYKQVFNASLAEYLNVIMFELSQRLHKAFSKVDMSFYTSSVVDEKNRKDNVSPFCLHQQPAKLVMVRKEGPNKGRFFYTCDAPKADQCKYFKWLDEVKGTLQANGKPESKLLMRDMNSLSKFIRCQNINLYEESQLMVRKISVYHKRHFGKFAKVVNTEAEFGGESKTKLYLKLNRKDNSSAYSKDDVWVVSKTLNFDPMDTFIACSVFFGPSANNDIEISPLRGYCPSNWQTNMIVHALLVCNASTELTCMRNIQEHFNSSTLPLMPHLLTLPSEYEKPNRISRGKFKPPAITTKTSSKCEIPDHNFVTNLAKDMINQFCLNEDQATALMQIALMMCSSDGPQKQQNPPITIIHGVFGAGKSYLLAVVVLFLVQLFENFNSPEEQGSSHWKLLISSSTNVAVDRVLLGLLDLGFHQFIRVGSIRKIAKPILPHSLHAGSENESEQLKELQALLKEDLSPGEKVYVRKSIEQHKLGTNKSMLGQVRVIGATCAACPFPCMSNLKFPVVILDECSQMTEPASLLPIARFQCEKLILVGDPKQLSPTIQGSEAAHECGLEQTLFDRLCLMGHQTVMLRTQYRCHPVISAVANELFYNGQLINGVSQEDRKPLLDWLPTLCFYNASGTEQLEGNNSFHNIEEANFTVKLIQSLIASGIQGSMIGVITLYKSQMSKICNLLGSMAYCDPVEMKAVQVSTVDAFQGAEKEIIILSCVRTRQVGFIDSEKRMNVALTRGRRHLLIVGSLACLRKNKLWEQVIHQCERQINGLKHVSQWDEKLSSILKLYQEKKEQELLTMQKKHPKGKAEKVKASLPT